MSTLTANSPRAGTIVEHKLRRFLLLVAGAAFVATLLELWFAGHTESAVQLVPFVLGAIGLVVTLCALWVANKGMVWILRGVMAITALGSLFGLYEHLEHNLAFEVEIRPGVPASEVFWEALSGASPLLAPGILAFAAVLAVAATYHHPVLCEGKEDCRSES